ncbi:MAG TPA: imidazole glycerol phosphate synthase subunit HisF, partial [Synergistales bacterium]|nr:imidazole glycerol phosphate synthase subunit HisF [Synergistales bacterium]
ARVVKGVNFVDLKDAGDPADLADFYMTEGADELVFLDISASVDRRTTLIEWVQAVADRIFIPFTVGGGISSVEQARRIITLGADKISLNTSAVTRPSLIRECSALLGKQAVVVAIDAKQVSSRKWEVYIEGGTKATGIDVCDWCIEAERQGCGEILLTSIDRDGTKNGYDLELIEKVVEQISVPLIASGGAGTVSHFQEGFQHGCDAALAASVFHFGEIRIRDLKSFLDQHAIPVRM